MRKRNNRTQPADQVQTLLEEFESHQQSLHDRMEVDGENVDGALQR